MKRTDRDAAWLGCGVGFGVSGRVVFSIFQCVNRDILIGCINNPVFAHSDVLIFFEFQRLVVDGDNISITMGNAD